MIRKIFDRKNQPIAVRVLHDASDDYNIRVRALEISDPALVIRHGNLSGPQQKGLSVSSLACSQYKRAPEEIPLKELRLILDSQITQEEHSETIVEPEDREVFMRHIRELMNGIDVYGHELRLAEIPFDTSYLQQGFILPPSVRVLVMRGRKLFWPLRALNRKTFSENVLEIEPITCGEMVSFSLDQ